MASLPSGESAWCQLQTCWGCAVRWGSGALPALPVQQMDGVWQRDLPDSRLWTRSPHHRAINLVGPVRIFVITHCSNCKLSLFSFKTEIPVIWCHSSAVWTSTSCIPDVGLKSALLNSRCSFGVTSLFLLYFSLAVLPKTSALPPRDEKSSSIDFMGHGLRK